MKAYFVVFTLLISSVLLKAQESKLIGSWLMTRVEIGENTEAPYFITSFNAEGEMVVMGIEVGTWKLNGNNIEMVSEMDKDFNGTSVIEKLTKKELVVTKGEAKLFYTKINQLEIDRANASSPFIGLWEIKSEVDVSRSIEFFASGDFKFLHAEYGMKSEESGTWIYNKKDQTIIFQSFSRSFRGLKTFKILNDNSIEILGEEPILLSKPEKGAELELERLTFEYEEFTDENENLDGTPWNYESILDFSQQISVIKYVVGDLLVEQNKFTFLDINVLTKIEGDEIYFTDYLVFDGDTSLYSEHFFGGTYGSYNYFFPENDIYPFRVVKKESVTVGAGTFDCTVVEGYDYETKCKFWMIDNKPGVYAKIIKESIDVFGEPEYKLIELEELIMK